MAEGFIAATVLGTALQIEGNRRAARAQERAALGEVAVKARQAEDIFERFELSRKTLFKRGQEVKGAQVAGFVKGGVTVGEGSTLLALEDTNRAITEAIDRDKFEADAQITALKQGAELNVAFAFEVRAAEKLGRIGLLLSGASTIAASQIKNK